MSEGQPTALAASLVALLEAVRRTRIHYVIVGAFALSAWGRPRSTLDFDIMIDAETIPERLIESLSGTGYEPDTEWARYNPMVRHLQTRFRSGRLVLDVLVPRDSHDRKTIERRIRRRFDNRYLWFPTPEDLLLQKLKVGRPQDFSDAIGIVERRSGRLDRRYLWRWARRLGIVAELQHVLRA